MARKLSRKDLEAWLCAWPGVTTDVKWGADLCFVVHEKMFCVFGTEGADAGGLSFKAGERFLELTDRPGFEPAPYLARAQWVKVADSSQVPRDELKALLRASYELIVAKLPKRVQKELLG